MYFVVCRKIPVAPSSAWCILTTYTKQSLALQELYIKT